VNIYRLLLRLAPRRLRDKHGREMDALFLARLTEASSRGRGGVLAVWLGATLDILSAAAREPRLRWNRRSRVGLPPERRTLMIGSDIRYALRSLTRQKLATGMVMGMLALGIGANVAVFALINGLFLKPFPFPEPERLVYINETAPRWNLELTSVHYPDFWRWHKDQQAFDAIALYDTRSFNVATDSGADRMDGAAVTADFAKVLRIEPVLGRMFTAEEDKPDGPRVALIGHAVWQERFGGRSDVLGKELRLNSRVFTVIGVLPKAAEFPGGVRLWVPLQENPVQEGTSYSFEGLGRLKPGISVEQATQDLVRAHQPIFDERDKEKVVTPIVRDLRGQFTQDYGTIASTLGAAVSLLLIVACANVAAVMLARALARRREMGIRLAVGASRSRLLRQLLVENIILSLLGGAIGLVLGQWAIQALVTALPDQAPSWTQFTLDGRTVVFTLATSMATALLFGWVPALHAMNADLRAAIASATAGSTPAVRGRRTLRALVIAEFALASLMFVCGGLLVRAYDRVRSVDPGFDPSGVFTLNVSLPTASYADDAARITFFQRLEEQVRALPGVTQAGLVSCAPVSGCHWGQFYGAEGAAPRGPNDVNPVVLNRIATPGYFAAMGIRLKDGRVFNAQDGVEGRTKDGTIIVNETFARTFWPDGKSPVGRRIRTGDRAPWLTVVGYVEDVKHYGLEQPMRPGVYYALPRMLPMSSMTVAIKTTGDPAQFAEPIRALVRKMNPELPTYNARTMDQRLAQSMTLRAVYSWILGVFAIMALLLALGGSYGVTSYLVSQRTRELGIRVALGAARGDISRAVLKGSLAVVTTGVVIGIAAAIGAGRWLASLLFGVPPYDLTILAVATMALFATGFLANWLPARRASRVDPMVSLRTD
jgi:predicted permease